LGVRLCARDCGISERAEVPSADWADHYGASAMYLRLNGILPPTAKKSGASE
jgi:hypothetical protein